MKKIFIIIIFSLVLTGCARQAPTPSVNNNIKINQMELFSNDFKNNTDMPSRFTCDGEDMRPHLAWSGVPGEAKSLSLAVFDPDAPGQGWLHYLVVNMPAQDSELKTQDSIPNSSVELSNDFGKVEYGGPCPPSGKHRYIFTLYALDTDKIEPPSYKDFLQLIGQHTVGKAEIIGLYQRQ